MKKPIIVILCIMIGLAIVGYTFNFRKNFSKSENNQNEMTILIKDYNYKNLYSTYTILKNYSQRFEREKGIKINFDIVFGEKPNDYEKNINMKLYLKDSPTLIFIAEEDSYINYIEEGVAVNVKEKIPNIARVYDSLFNDGYYFIPIGMSHRAISFNRNAIDKLGIDEPNFNLTKEEYLKVEDRWTRLNPEYFSAIEYLELIESSIGDLEIIDESNKEVYLNNDRVIECINNMREDIFSGKYILNENYNYENYYNMIFVEDSDEYKSARHYKEYTRYETLMDIWFTRNGLKSTSMDTVLYTSENVILPNIIDENIDTWGLVVNRNGKNIDLACEFINGLLSDEVQLEMFSSKGDVYPVNKYIESEISKIEEDIGINEKAAALRKFILEQIKIGKYKRPSNSGKADEIRRMLCEDFAVFIFADEQYTDKKLSRELQILENKYTMWLKE